MTKRDVLSATDLSREELENLLDLAARMKSRKSGQTLSGRTLGLLFFDRSLRTRVSFDVAITQLGGHCIQIFAQNEIYDLEPGEQVVMDGAAEEQLRTMANAANGQYYPASNEAELLSALGAAAGVRIGTTLGEEREPNNTIGKASPIAASGQVKGSLNPAPTNPRASWEASGGCSPWC